MQKYCDGRRLTGTPVLALVAPALLWQVIFRQEC